MSSKEDEDDNAEEHDDKDEEGKENEGRSASGSKASSASKASGSAKEGRKRRRKRRRRRASSGSGSSRRRRRHRSSHRGRRRGSSRRSRSNPMDRRPLVERVKGGIKLFVGRLPVETTSDLLSRAFEEYGEVLEVFLIDGRGASGARCAFVRLSSLQDAERAIEEMHEKRVLVHERAELGPIQVAFAKGEAIRMGLDASKEQLPARWQVPVTSPGLPPPGPVEPESLGKEALIGLIKEGQRSGGQPFKQQWWNYCDQGKGGVADYDPKRHSESSLRHFFAAAQSGEWGSKPWFRRAVNWATMGGAGSRGHRRRRRRRKGSSSSSSGRSRSGSRSASRKSADEGGREAAEANGAASAGHSSAAGPAKAVGPGRPGLAATSDLLSQPPLPAEAPPPEPDAHSKPRLLSSAAERDTALEEFLAKNRISPSTSFLMLKLTREQAAFVMQSVAESLESSGASHLAKLGQSAAESLVLQRLKGLGVRTTTSAGSWTSTERTASPPAIPALERLRKSEAAAEAERAGLASSAPRQGEKLGLDLPSVDGLLGPVLADLEALAELEPEVPAEPTTKVPHEEPKMQVGDHAPAKGAETGAPEPEAPKVTEAVERRPKKTKPPAPPGCEVFVKNLDTATGEPELRDLFGRHGTVLDVEMATEEGASVARGYAIVLMSSTKEAKQCVKALNFTKPWGRALIVERDDTAQDSPSPSPSKEKAATAPAKAPEEPRKPSRERSKSRSASNESGWSRYTIEGKGRSRPRGRRKASRRRHHEKKRSKAKTRGRGSSKPRSSSGSSDKKKTRRSKSKDSDSRSSKSSRSGDSRSKRHRHRDKHRDKEASGWPGAPFMPPVPGMPPMMPPPWAMPPWGMPPMCLDRNGFPSYDSEEAERQLRKAEKAAKKEEQRRRKEVEEKEKTQVWEDHPARMAQKQSRSRSRRSGSGSQKPAGAKKRRKASRSGSSRKHRGRRRSSNQRDGDAHAGVGPPMPLGWPPSYLGYGGSFPVAQSPKRSKSRAKAPKEQEKAEEKDDSGESDVDLTKVQEEINFADI